MPDFGFRRYDKFGYSNVMAYDPDNIFAKILRGDISSHKIYEDDGTLAFLDIMPRTEGHALVITKETARDLFDIQPDALAKLMGVVQKLAPKIKEAVGADGVLIQQFNGAAAGRPCSTSTFTSCRSRKAWRRCPTPARWKIRPSSPPPPGRSRRR